MPNKIDIDAVEARIEKLRGEYEAAWHAVWAEEARSVVRTILRHRRAGNRDAAKAVRRLLPSRNDWREWTGTQNARQMQRYARSARDAEMMAYAAYLHAVDRPGVIATDPVAGLLYDAGIGLPRQPEGGAVLPYSRVELDRGAANRNTDRKECGLVVVFRS